MFQEADPGLMRWAIGAILSWQPTPLADTPVFHIHGQRDRMIRASTVAPDCLLPDGGHLINLSHAAEVNDFIRKVLTSVAGVATSFSPARYNEAKETGSLRPCGRSGRRRISSSSCLVCRFRNKDVTANHE